MKLKKDKMVHKLPELIGEVLSACIDERKDLGYMHNVQQVKSPPEILRMRNESEAEFGRPEYFALAADEIYVFPIPDKDYKLNMVIYSPAKNI